MVVKRKQTKGVKGLDLALAVLACSESALSDHLAVICLDVKRTKRVEHT